MKNSLLFMLLFLTIHLFSTVINIPADYATIQAGIDASVESDTVLVQPDAYVENISFPYHNITLGSLFLTTEDQTYISSTIISGTVSLDDGSIDSSTLFTGFTVTNGNNENGGGVYIDNGVSPNLQNLVITGNTATEGGGVYCGTGSAPVLQNLTITDNSATGCGGIYCSDTADPTLINTIVWNNSSTEIEFDQMSDPCSITISYSDIEGGESGIYEGTGTVNWLAGNINSDPLFVDAANGDYTLQNESPCIDKGDTASPLDPDGTRADIGATYFQQYIGPVWYVAKTGSDITGNGSEENPFGTIQFGADYVSNIEPFTDFSDTLIVTPGIYTENIFYNATFVLGSMFLITGNKEYISSTIIQGHDDGLGGSSVYMTGYGSNLYSPSIISGFTITGNCQIAIVLEGSYTMLDHILLTGNTTNESWGTCIDARNGFININSCTISENTYPGTGSVIRRQTAGDFNINNSIIINNGDSPIDNGTAQSILASYSVMNDFSDCIGLGLINTDPLFINSENGDFNLNWTDYPTSNTTKSQCIDSGDPELKDPDGTRCDIGAFHFFQDIVADFTSNTHNGLIPLTVNFTDLSFHNSIQVDEWYWDFGDGATSDLQNPTHTFNSIGSYTVSLTASKTGTINSSTEIKIDLISVSADEEPLTPGNIIINTDGNDVEINWDPVTESIFGNYVKPYYIIYDSSSPYSGFSFLGIAEVPQYTHQHIGQFSNKNFYKVSAYVGELSKLKELIKGKTKIEKMKLEKVIEKERKVK